MAIQWDTPTNNIQTGGIQWDNTISPDVNSSQPPQSLSDTIWNGIANNYGVKGITNYLGGVKDAAMGGINQIKEGFNQATSGQGNPITTGAGAGLKMESGLASVVTSPVAPIFQPIGQVINKVGQAIGGTQAAQSLFPVTPAGGKNPAVVNEGPQIKTITSGAENLANAGNIAQTILGVDQAVKNAPAAYQKIKETTSDVGGQIKGMAQDVNNLRPTEASIAAERQAKITQGFEEQNTRLKSADKAFNDNITTRQITGPDGQPTTVTKTPIDTFAENNIAPVIEKGSIQMGDYKTGTGELGKIKTLVENLDNEIDTKLENTGLKIDLEQLKTDAIKAAQNNPEFIRSGSVLSNIKKIEARFNDYLYSYGDSVDIAELNNIRKVANKDWSPETQDVSRVVGDVARQYVYEATPNAEIKTLLQKQGDLLAARKYAEAINGTKVVGGRLGNYTMRTAGAVVGAGLKKMPVAGPVLGAIGGEYLSRAMQQTQFRSAWTELKSLLVKHPGAK